MKKRKQTSIKANKIIAGKNESSRMMDFLNSRKKRFSKDLPDMQYANELKNYYESIIACMPSNVYWLDKNCVLLGGNDTLAKMFGLKSRADLVGLTYKQMAKLANWKDGYDELFKQEDIDVMNTGVPRLNVEEPPVIINGETKYYITNKMPLYGTDGKILGVAGISTDITQIKKAEMALKEAKEKTEEANKSRIEFLTTVTHEIRNPVGNISTYDVLLKNDLKKVKEFFYKEIVDGLSPRKKDQFIEKYGELFNRIHECVDIIGLETQKALDYLKGVGELQRLQEEGIKPHFQSIQFKELIDEIISDTLEINTQNIEVMVSIAARIPEVINIDYFNIADALRVVLSNAIRFSAEKTVVKLDASSDKKYVKIEIENFGQAMAKDQIQALFENEHDRKVDSKTRIYRKPSLRLTQAKMKIEASGGKLDIKSGKNNTRVTVCIPYNLNSGELLSENGSKNSSVYFKQRNVLVVEDDPHFQKTEKRIIEELGHSCKLVSTGAEALKQLGKNKYDVVFLDISLPDIQGTDLLTKIRKLKKDLPVVIITSHSHKKDIDHFERLGATLVLPKPLTEEDFKECLEFDFESDEDDD